MGIWWSKPQPCSRLRLVQGTQILPSHYYPVAGHTCPAKALSNVNG